jgi:hypothetical protein
MSHIQHAIRRSSLLAVVLLVTVSLGGCLLVERKEYHFTVKPDGSGTGRITFVNIMSAEDEADDPSPSDYRELITKYLNGNRFEKDHPQYTNVRKRLYEEDGVLNGEISFDFQTYTDISLYRFQGKGTWMYYTNPGGFNYEHYESSNGEYGGDTMPILFWPDETTAFEIKTTFEKSERKTRSLLPLYRRLGTN